jgi:hypothetical protein
VPMIEVSDIRKRVKARLDQIKRESVERRTRIDAATRAYESFLADIATPVFRMFASVLKAEGYPFALNTPGGGLRLASDRSADDFIELFLDVAADPPVAAARINRGRGRRLVNMERPIREDAAVEQLTDEDVVRFLLEEIRGFVER